jgi:hypothetical protein
VTWARCVVAVGAGVAVGVGVAVAVAVGVAVDPSPDWADPLDVLGLVAAAPFDVTVGLEVPFAAAAAVVALPLFVSAAAIPKIATAAVPAAPAAMVRPWIRATARSRLIAFGRLAVFMSTPCPDEPFENVRTSAAVRNWRPGWQAVLMEFTGNDPILPLAGR